MGDGRLPVIYSHNAATGTGPGDIIDISTGDGPTAKFVMVLTMSGGSSVAIEGSQDGVNFQRWSPATGFTSNVAKRLEFGVRFWRTNILTNAGTVTSSVGPAPRQEGGWRSANLMRP